MNRRCTLALVLGLLCLAAAGCSKAGWQAWKEDIKQTGQALSGTGEFQGTDARAREIEKSINAHRP